MLKFIRNTLRLLLIAFPLAVSLVFFQNCSRVQNTGNENSLGGGTGTDGKTYASYGQCPDGTKGVSSIVKIGNDQRALLVRQDCEALDTPQVIAISDLKFAANDSSVMSLNGQVYDQQTNMPKVTMELCQSSGTPAIETKVWQVSGDTSSLYGSLVQGGGAASGTLKVASSSPLNFSTVAGQNSSFDLALTSSAGGSLTYSLNGSASVSVSTVSCLYQELPDPFPTASNTGVPSGKVLSNSGDITITTNGTVIDSKLITGCVVVKANNVTIRNSRILGGSCAQPVSINAPYSGLLVEDSEIDGQNSATCSEAIGNSGYTIRRGYIHGCDEGPRLSGSFNITIQDSYVANKSHGTKTWGLKLAAGNSVKLIHNTIATSNGPAIFTADNATGDLIIDSNLLVGANYPLTLYDNRAWVQNNLIYDNSGNDLSSYYGPVSTFFGNSKDPGVTIMEWTNNHLTSKRDGSVIGRLLSQPR